jgi:4-hydroxybenzoate polyprenyltransferase
MTANTKAAITHLLLAAAAAAMVFQTDLLLSLKVDPIYIIVIFLSAFFVYRLSYLGLKFEKRNRNQYIQLFILLILIFTGLSFTAKREVAGLAVMFVCCLLYFTELQKWKGIRSIPFIKSAWVAFVWSIVTAWIPLGYSLERHHLLHLAERFLFMAAICIIYNLRDLKTDKDSGLVTMPMKIGVRGSINLAVTMLLIDFVIVLIREHSGAMQYALLLSIIYTAAVVLFAREDGKWNYYTFGIDGCMIVQTIMVSIAFIFK